jgi:hypothetical protein
VEFSKGYWTHTAFMDVFVEVLSVLNSNEDFTQLAIRWWNKSQTNNPYMISPNLKIITVVKEQYNNWEKIEFNRDL